MGLKTVYEHPSDPRTPIDTPGKALPEVLAPSMGQEEEYDYQNNTTLR